MAAMIAAAPRALPIAMASVFCLPGTTEEPAEEAAVLADGVFDAVWEPEEEEAEEPLLTVKLGKKMSPNWRGAETRRT